MICADCGKKTNQSINGEPLCSECSEKRTINKVRAKEDEIKAARDFKEWKPQDMSELFWIHLGIWAKEPNIKSLEIMRHAYLWAVHDNKGLANSFVHAMEWAGIKNIQLECIKWRKKESEG